MSATPVDLAAARGMDPDRKTGHEGQWYLRQILEDDYHVALLSEWAPAATLARDLRPGCVEITCDNEDGLELDPVLLAAFLQWPPAAGLPDAG